MYVRCLCKLCAIYANCALWRGAVYNDLERGTVQALHVRYGCPTPTHTHTHTHIYTHVLIHTNTHRERERERDREKERDREC